MSRICRSLSFWASIIRISFYESQNFRRLRAGHPTPFSVGQANLDEVTLTIRHMAQAALVKFEKLDGPGGRLRQDRRFGCHNHGRRTDTLLIKLHGGRWQEKEVQDAEDPQEGR